MLVEITCPIEAHGVDGRIVKNPEVLAELNELVDPAMDMAAHFSQPLEQLGLVDDGIRFKWPLP